MSDALATALSGLSSNQRAIGLAAANIANANTPGYVRRIAAFQSVSIGGVGAGVSVGNGVRQVDEALLRDVRGQAADRGAADAANRFRSAASALFGAPGDQGSLSSVVAAIGPAMGAAAADIGNQTALSAAIASVSSAASRLADAASGIQALRLSADAELGAATNDANDKLTVIAEANREISIGKATGADTGDAEDRRDLALTELSGLLPVRSGLRGDGSVDVRTSDGRALVSGNHAARLSHAVASVAAPGIGGSGFGGVLLDDGTGRSIDISPGLSGGRIGALVAARDVDLPRAQSRIDRLAAELRDALNQENNKGTAYPSIRRFVVGSRGFADVSNQTANAPTTGVVPPSLQPPPQRVSWRSGDTTISLFGPDGREIASASMKTLLADPSVSDASGSPTSIDASAGVALPDLAAKIQNWMRAQTTAGARLSAATSSFSGGSLAVDSGTPAASIAFSDAPSSGGASIGFDADGDGAVDSTSSGFSNFFGLNDMFSAIPSAAMDSDIVGKDWTAPMTRTLTLIDKSGPIGGAVPIPARATLTDIAARINAMTATAESRPFRSQTISVSGSPSVSVSDSSGPMPGFPVAIPSGTTSLSDIAAAIDGAGGSVRAKVVRNGSDGWRLSVFDARGVPIDASFAGGSVGGSSMEDFVGMSRTERISASVVTEGSGQRLRISGNAGGGIDIAAGWNSSTPPQSLITDLGLAPSVVGAASGLVLRDDIAENPSAASRRTVLTDTASGRRYLSSGDGSGMAALAAAMATSRPTPESGGLAVGATTLTGYAATIVSAAASDAAAAERNASYQNALGESLDQRLSSASGVNIDEEAADMMRFQQAYNAAARIVVVLQDMMKTLTDMIK